MSKNLLLKETYVTLYCNDVVVGTIVSDDIEIREDSFLYGGEPCCLYDIYCDLEGKLVFASASCKSADLIGNNLYFNK